MPLAAEPQALLDARAEAGWPEFHTLTPPEARETMAHMREALGPVAPEAVARVKNRTIPGPVGEIPVRIYWPDADAPYGLGRHIRTRAAEAPVRFRVRPSPRTYPAPEPPVTKQLMHG